MRDARPSKNSFAASRVRSLNVAEPLRTTIASALSSGASLIKNFAPAQAANGQIKMQQLTSLSSDRRNLTSRFPDNRRPKFDQKAAPDRSPSGPVATAIRFV